MVKSSTKVQNKISSKTFAKKSSLTRQKQGAISKLTRSTKRYGKQTLRDLLLSKTFHNSFKVIVGIMVSASALYGTYAFIGNTFANDIVVSKSEILSRVSKLVELPKEETPEAVVRVQDAGVLKKQNDFYANVKEGDYIIMYSNIALIYDLRNNSIVALKRTERQ